MALTRSIGARQDATRGTAPVEVRKGIAAQYIRPGVLPGGATPLVTGTSGMAYSVGAAGFVTSRGAADGFHLFTNDGSVTVGTTGVGSTVPAAPGTGLSRIDIVWVFHPSAGDNADTTSEPAFGVSSGTAASSPVAPSLPPGALELARNVMSAGVTSTAMSGNSISQTAPYTAVRGAPVLVRNAAERDALTVLASAASPIEVDRLDTGARERNAGSGWGPVAAAGIYAHMSRSTNATPVPGDVALGGWTTETLGGGITGASGVYTVPRAGRYLITASVPYAASVVGTGRALYVVRNGVLAANRIMWDEGTGSANNATILKVSRSVVLAAGDTIGLRTNHNGSPNLVITGGDSGFWFTIDYQGAA